MHSQRLSLIPILLTVFIDLLGVGVVIPILAPLFLDLNSGILPVNTSFQAKTFLLGIIISAYSIAQFFGAPVLGTLSDKYGRKKILLASLAGTAGGYVLFGLGIAGRNFLILLFSRLLHGFAGGSVSTAMSATADISSEADKAHNFGLMGMVFGLGFILGPFIGGKLSDNTIIPWFNFTTPFWFAALLVLVNIVLVFLFFPETLSVRVRAKVSLLQGFYNIKRSMEFINLRVMFIVLFLLTVGFNFFVQFFPVYLVNRLQFNQSRIGDIFAYAALWFALTQGLFTGYISKFFSINKIVTYSLFLLALSFPLMVIPQNFWQFYFFVPLIAIFTGLAMPNINALISNHTDRQSQGEILGISQSIQSLGQALPPIISGIIVQISITFPIFFAGVVTFAAWIVYIKYYNSKYDRR